ncbi:hypothetical protein H0H92_012650 [Tricholoma furcatifolium]|nr:hypothetical protein H0H92_012650 [Tricholoma furcatifolium]
MSIILSTPPPSPALQLNCNDSNDDIEILALPEPTPQFDVSPVKRPRAYASHPRKKRHRSLQQMNEVADSTFTENTAEDTFHDSPTTFAPPERASSPGIDDWANDGPELPDTWLPSGWHAPSNGDTDSYSEFLDLALSACIGFYQLTASIFVVQGWDHKTANVTRRWYHLQIMKIGTEVAHICLCPYAAEKQCMHSRFLKDYGEREFPEEPDMPSVLGPIKLIYRDIVEGGHLFSVETPAKFGIKSRAIVQHEGDHTKSAVWRCSKDGNQGCYHIQKARDYLQKLIHLDPDARDLNYEIREYATQATSVVNGAPSISYKPIIPPIWAELHTDLPLPYTRPKPVVAPPAMISLELDAQCACGAIRDQQKNIIHATCRVYSLLGCYDTTIELQECSTCYKGRRRCVGPDGRELGLFNYNNRIIFTHELLDEYTMAYTSSETPFVAWVSLVTRRYQSFHAQNPFVNATIFRAAWFGYASLLELNDDFLCSHCGPTPNELIFDGVVVSFSKNRILSSLHPPTLLHSASQIRKSRLPKSRALIKDTELRKNIRRIVEGATKVTKSSSAAPVEQENGSSESESDSIDSHGTKAQREILAQRSIFPSVLTGLSAINVSLGQLFNEIYGDDRRLPISLPYKSRESISQMATRPALAKLKNFNEDPCINNATLLLDIPCIYNVLMHELASTGNKFSSQTLGVCQWLYECGVTFLEMLNFDDVPAKNLNAMNSDGGWKQSGSYYNMPQIRHRPVYPNIRDDNRAELSGKRSAHCSKFYARYSQQRMSGGILAAWCTHSICYGFHSIPSGEGRNDVFSALITHWENAPKIIVYDFACALGPYCLAREPEFFADTLFVVDDFHSDGHTCSEATTLKAYCEVDPRLSRINSSAAECGNGGLARIKKSVSYMTQDRAIIYTKIFISMWNRMKLKRMEDK